MNVRSSFPAGASDQTIAEALRAPLLASALPGDADSLADHEIDRIVDFIADTASRRAPGEPALRPYRVAMAMYRKGFYVRYGGDTIQLAPPFISTAAEIDSLTAALGETLDETD